MKLEDQIDAEVIQAAPAYGCILLRNNSGAMKDATGRLVRYGLGNDSKQRNAVFASSDRIGITSVVITQEMVGQTIGVFTAIEMKREGWTFKGDRREVAQQNFINWVLKAGGYAGFANCIDDLRRILRR